MLRGYTGFTGNVGYTGFTGNYKLIDLEAIYTQDARRSIIIKPCFTDEACPDGMICCNGECVQEYNNSNIKTPIECADLLTKI